MTDQEALIQFEVQLHYAQEVLDSGFGTHEGEANALYKRRKGMAECAISALRERLEHGWISVEDAMPNQPPDTFHDGFWWGCRGDDFIVCDTEKRVFLAHYSFGCSCMNYFWYMNSLTPLKNITHWMPLPQPPAKEET